jgi:hypothetical protein
LLVCTKKAVFIARKKQSLHETNFGRSQLLKNPMNNRTITGTNIEEVKRLNSQSGLSYNQVKQLLAEKYKNKKEE